jgi:PAS domain S-box-containing protein
MHRRRAAAPNALWLKSWLWALGLAAGANAFVSVITYWVLQSRTQVNVIFIFLLAIIACAFFGGYVSGWVATLIFNFVVPFLFVPGFSLARTDWTRLLFMLAIATVVSYIRARQLRAEEALRQANEELERRVEERTERLMSETAVRVRTQQQLAAIVEHSQDAIISTDIDGRIQTWNAGAEILYGYTAEEMIGATFERLIPKDRVSERATALAKLKAGERVQHFETVRIRKNSNPVDVSLTMSPIRDSSRGLVGISHVARDITAQKQLEEKLRQSQKLESLGVLSGGISHDFNNLLVGIMGNASLALDSLPPGSQVRTLIEGVLIASQRASDLTRQLMAYAGRARVGTQRIDLPALIGEIASLVQSSIPKKVELRLELPDGLPAIEGDAAQIQQIVMNLIINGGEAIGTEQPGTVTVRAGTAELTEADLLLNIVPGEHRPGRYVFLSVRDTGCGMDEATRRRIFDPFFTTKFTGRGLGLSAALGIVQTHRGALTLETAPGRGSTFKVFLPEAEGPAPPAEAPARAREWRGSGTILVIDDEQVVLNVARAALERFGYHVIVAHDGERGVEVFREMRDRIRLVLLDLAMPKLDGVETLARLRQLSQDVPVVLSSGFDESEARGRFEDADLAGFLQKPFTSTELAKKVYAVCYGS